MERQISNLRFDIPGNAHFQFECCAAYKRFSKDHVHEMDYCWWDSNVLYLLEAYDCRSSSVQKKLEKKTIYEIVEETVIFKGFDSLFLLASMWLETAAGNELKKDLRVPFPNRIPPELYLIFVLRISGNWKEQSVQIGSINDYIRVRFRERLSILNADIVICNKESLKSMSLNGFSLIDG